MTALGPYCALGTAHVGEIVFPDGHDPVDFLQRILAQRSDVERKTRIRHPLTRSSKSKDYHVREVLRNELRSECTSNIIEELVLFSPCGDARVDIAVIDQDLHGYEIKSASDSLKRLKQQIEVYSAVLDRVTLVVDERHTEAVLGDQSIPTWWGLIEVYRLTPARLRLRRLRASRKNPAPDPGAILSLLWKNELRELLARHNITHKERDTANLLAAVACSRISAGAIRDFTVAALKERGDWRQRRRFKKPSLDL